MNFLNLLCNITFQKRHILIQSPCYVSIVNYTFGSEYKENKDYFTYGTWEIFLDPLRQLAKEMGRKIHIPRDHYFNLIHRLYFRHVEPGLKRLLEENPNRYSHTFVFALPYFINEQGEIEVSDETSDLPIFSHTIYRKEMKFSEVALEKKKKKERWT